MTKESGEFDQIDQWKSTMFLYSSALKSINTKIEILNNEFIQLYNYNPIEHITSRLKTPESIVKKLKHDGCEVTIDNMVEHLNDIAGIRIICSFMSDIYPIADMIARQADITVLHVKDYIKSVSYTHLPSFLFAIRYSFTAIAAASAPVPSAQ